jgi:Gamma-glutamyl cyclotransferase, AIG2-like
MAEPYIMLFQYGSNMDPDRLNSSERLDGAAEVVGIARLTGWGIRFDLYSETNRCGVTDIIPSAREYVEGILFQVPYSLVVSAKGQRSRMDEIEGARRGKKGNYKRLKVLVEMGGKKIWALTYVGTVLGRRRYLKVSAEDRRVSDAYFNHLLIGARQFSFSADYVAYLQRQAGH